MIRHLTTSTLFPYTTLFRSGPDHQLAVGIGSQREGDVDRIRLDLLVAERQLVRGEGGAAPRAIRQDLVPAVQEDRKSTRLNSSHVETSYAVFCLKEKNQS